jgi:hypothetical protein
MDPATDMNPDPGGNPAIFREVQHFFRQWIFLLPVAAVTVIVWYEFAQQIVLGHPQGEEPIPNWLAWVLTIVFGLGFPAAGLLIRLVTEVRPGELLVRLYPFRWVTFPVEAIGKAAVREYSPIKEYGGWGIRVSKWNGRAYNAFGNQGVQLELKTGALVLIGSQRPQELITALQTAGFKAEATKPARKQARSRGGQPARERRPARERDDDQE